MDKLTELFDKVYLHEITEAEALQQAAQFLEEAVEPDEDYYEHDGDVSGYLIAGWRNELRAEIRKKLGL